MRCAGQILGDSILGDIDLAAGLPLDVGQLACAALAVEGPFGNPQTGGGLFAGE